MLGMFRIGVSLIVLPVNDPPSLDPIADRTVDEGSGLRFTVSASDIEHDTLTYSLDAAPADATIDASTGLFSWLATDGPATVPVTVRVTDTDGAFATNSFDITVRNVAPTLTIAGAGRVTQGQPYTLDLAAADPGRDSISGWRITWGDGTVDDIAGNPSSLTHTYRTAGSVTVSASATDDDGSYAANTLSVNVTTPETLQVSTLRPRRAASASASIVPSTPRNSTSTTPRAADSEPRT